MSSRLSLSPSLPPSPYLSLSLSLLLAHSQSRWIYLKPPVRSLRCVMPHTPMHTERHTLTFTDSLCAPLEPKRGGGITRPLCCYVCNRSGATKPQNISPVRNVAHATLFTTGVSNAGDWWLPRRLCCQWCLQKKSYSARCLICVRARAREHAIE